VVVVLGLVVAYGVEMAAVVGVVEEYLTFVKIFENF
jgi:hypothetical protein